MRKFYLRVCWECLAVRIYGQWVEMTAQLYTRLFVDEFDYWLAVEDKCDFCKKEEVYDKEEKKEIQASQMPAQI